MTDAADSASAATFERLLRPHFAPMNRVALRLTRSVSDAEDLLQEVLASLYEQRQQLSEIADLKTWLARVIYNRFIDQRRASRWRLLERSFDSHGAADEEESLLDQIPSDDLGPEENAALAGQICQLEAALSKLADDQRIAVLLHDAEGFTFEEIEQITGTPAGTVKSRVHRGRAKLRLLLGEGTFFD